LGELGELLSDGEQFLFIDDAGAAGLSHRLFELRLPRKQFEQFVA
jgi:hypothetical protein